MKKILFVAVAISIFNFQFSIVSAQQVKIKKGKVTMSEEYYNSLMAQTAQLDAARARIAELEAKLARPAMKNFNDSASKYNTYIRKFPQSIIAGMRGFEKKPYFEAEEGANKAPKVEF